jgi:hypothetical protein
MTSCLTRAGIGDSGLFLCAAASAFLVDPHLAAVWAFAIGIRKSNQSFGLGTGAKWRGDIRESLAYGGVFHYNRNGMGSAIK